MLLFIIHNNPITILFIVLLGPVSFIGEIGYARGVYQILGRNGRFLFGIFYELKIELLLNLVPCTVDLVNR